MFYGKLYPYFAVPGEFIQMKSAGSYKVNIRTVIRTAGFLLPVLLFFFIPVAGRAHSLLIDSTVRMVDGMLSPYNQLQPGDTVFLAAGERNKLLIRNIQGAPGQPVVFMNKGGVVLISTNDYYGISVVHSGYFRISGQGESGVQYGIQIRRVQNGAGIGIGDMSTDFELDHLSIENCLTSGIFAKTEPDCVHPVSRENFTQYNTLIHDNYISATGNEGMYIGSSGYAGRVVNCNGKDSLMMPPVLEGVQVYNNVISHTGWDGIQVSSAISRCAVYGNIISHDSDAEINNQMSGILLGGGSSCDCYNNRITDGKGDGVEDHGIGGNRIFNNIIINAGLTYKPADPAAMKHGLFISDVSALPNSSVAVLFNTIVNSKSDGIRYQRVKGKQNLIVSNLIVNPGNYVYYRYAGTAARPEDAYVMINVKGIDLTVTNNFFSTNLASAVVDGISYTPLAGSPLINTAFPDYGDIGFEFLQRRRPVGQWPDIGAIEYDGGSDTMRQRFSTTIYAFPNPVQSGISIRYAGVAGSPHQFRVYSVNGQSIFQLLNLPAADGLQQIQFNTNFLAKGIYFYTVYNGAEWLRGKFVRR